MNTALIRINPRKWACIYEHIVQLFMAFIQSLPHIMLTLTGWWYQQLACALENVDV
jgi:hypothetical protein